MTDKPEGNYALAMPPDTWRDKLRRKLFPYRPCYYDPDPKVKWQGCVGGHIMVHISFVDRIKLLFTGRIKVDIKMAVDVKIGNHELLTSANVCPFRWLERRNP
jgi:hypothetical protein